MSLISLKTIKDIDEKQVKYYNANVERYRDRNNLIREREMELLSNTVGACAKEKVTEILPALSDIDEMVLKRKIDSNFYNIDTMTAASCVIDATFYVPVNTLGTLIRLKKWIRNLKKLSNTQVGVALKGDLATAEDIFVLKAPKQEHHNDDIIHEAVVGIYGTNKLRRHIPNFAYCYGVFSCASPIMTNGGQVASWCVGDSKVYYMITENIQPSISYKDYIKTATVDEFLAAYLQVLYSLNEAHKQIDFTHYDLHSDNVLMREYKNNSYFQIQYNTENGKEYLVSNRVATIIDHGFSHIEYDDKHYGVDLAGYSIYSGRSHIMHDAYKLLLFTVRDTIGHNDEVVEAALTIYKFFSNENLLNILDEHFDLDRFALPAIFGGTIFELTSFIRSKFDCCFIAPDIGGYDLLQCTLDNKCPNVQSIFNDIGLTVTGEKRARDFMEYYEAIGYGKDNVTLNYDTAKKDFKESITEDYKHIADNIANLNVMPLDTMEEYMSFLYLLLETLDNYNTLLLEIHIGIKVMKMHKEKADFSEFLDALKHLLPLVGTVDYTENKMNEQNMEVNEKYNHVEVANRIIDIYENVAKQKVIG